jgi:hypothetical protein
MSSIADFLSTQPRHLGLAGFEAESGSVFEPSSQLADLCSDEKEGSSVDWFEGDTRSGVLILGRSAVRAMLVQVNATSRWPRMISVTTSSCHFRIHTSGSDSLEAERKL